MCQLISSGSLWASPALPATFCAAATPKTVLNADDRHASYEIACRKLPAGGNHRMMVAADGCKRQCGQSPLPHHSCCHSAPSAAAAGRLLRRGFNHGSWGHADGDRLILNEYQGAQANVYLFIKLGARELQTEVETHERSAHHSSHLR